MKTLDIITLINNPQAIQSREISILDSILLEHPYFQIGQLLLTKGLLNTKNLRYNRQLRKASIYCLDRKKLFHLITVNKSITTDTKTIEREDLEKTEEKIEPRTPLNFNKNEYYSFSEWLTLLNVKKIERNESDLVDLFLKKRIKTSKPKDQVFFKATNIAKESLIENDELVTPTLAKVYLEQEHYEKAISAYEKLILKYPKKNSFFAAQIKLITKLKNN